MKFAPTIEGASLEPRLALSSLPFVTAPPGVAQASIDFTTKQAAQVLHGAYQALTVFPHSHDLTRLNATLAKLAARVPGGPANLLRPWLRDVAPLAIIPREWASSARELVRDELAEYLGGHVGTTLNYLASRGVRNELPAVATNGRVP